VKKYLAALAIIEATVLWFLTPEYLSLLEQNTRYAAIIAAVANGGQLTIGEGWLISCKSKRIPAVY
jgi:hypothetical protein